MPDISIIDLVNTKVALELEIERFLVGRLNRFYVSTGYPISFVGVQLLRSEEMGTGSPSQLVSANITTNIDIENGVISDKG